MMREVAPETELAELLAKHSNAGGVVDYVILEPQGPALPSDLHRAAALAGMAAIDRRLEKWATSHATDEYPAAAFFRVHWDEARLTGERVLFSVFWGSDDVEPQFISDCAQAIPNVDGYKTAFFHPPHGLSGSAGEQARLFAEINDILLRCPPEQAEIFSWSTEWSNYFDAGHEWWGAFYWTVRPASSRRFVVIAASSTD